MNGRKEYLMRAVKLKRMIRRKEQYLDSIRSCIPYSGPRMGDVKVDSNRVHSPVEDAALKAAALSGEIEKDRRRLGDLTEENSRIISSLSDYLEYTVMNMRYVQCLEWEEIISRSGYSRSSVFKIHGNALAKVHV